MPVTQPVRPADEWSAAFAEICDRYRGRLVHWATAIFGARDAEDIAQEALARLYARPDLLDPASDAWPWLSVVARNVGRDLARRNALSTTVEQDVFAAIPADGTVSDEVIARDDAARLARALRRLTTRERAVIRLRDIEGATIAEIADIVGSNENAVRQQLYRARRRLANVYLAMGGERSLSLPALVSLRLRELVRRYGHYLADLATGSSALLAAALPPLAAIVGGLGAGIPNAAAVPSGIGGTVAAAYAGREPGHGVAPGPGAALLGTAAPAAHPAPRMRPRWSPPPDPFVDVDKSVGPAGAHVTMDEPPTKRGKDEHEIWVMLPNGSRLRVFGDGDSPVGWVACRLAPLVDCT
jgi:RNA polymerase sigma-70 factor (ECF subfamily)